MHQLFHSPTSLCLRRGLLWLSLTMICSLATASTVQATELASLTVVAHDTFTNNSSDRQVGDPLTQTTSEVGGLTWYAYASTQFGVDSVGDSGANMNHIGSLPFNPLNHPNAEVAVIDATFDIGDADWIGVGFSSTHNGHLWTTGQPWMLLRSVGNFKIFGQGNVGVLDGPAPVFHATGQNTVRLAYDSQLHQVSAWINNQLVADGLPLNSFGSGFTIEHAAFHLFRGGGSVAAMQVDEFTVAVTQVLPQLTLAVTSQGVTVDGLSNGSSAVITGFAMHPEPWKERLEIYTDSLTDNDSNGQETYTPKSGIPPKSLWAVVDFPSGAFAVAGLEDLELRSFDCPVTASPGVSQLDFGEQKSLLLTVIRPQVGLWQGQAHEGTASDLDGASSTDLVADLTHLNWVSSGLAGGSPAPLALTQLQIDDVVIGFDPIHLEYCAVRVLQ